MSTIERHQLDRPTLSARRLLVVFVAAFVSAEFVGAYLSIPAQAGVDAVLSLIAINVAVFARRATRTTGLVMAALFTDRLVVLTFPASDISTTTRIGIVALFTVGIAYIVSRLLGSEISDNQSDNDVAEQTPQLSSNFVSAISVLAGFPIGWLAYQFLSPAPLVIQGLFGSVALAWAVAVAAIALGAVGEELLFRRLVATMVDRAWQSRVPWVSASLYGSVFLATANIGLIALMTLAGALFAWSCQRTGSIKPVVAAHGVASLLLFVVLPN